MRVGNLTEEVICSRCYLLKEILFELMPCILLTLALLDDGMAAEQINFVQWVDVLIDVCMGNRDFDDNLAKKKWLNSLRPSDAYMRQ